MFRDMRRPAIERDPFDVNFDEFSENRHEIIFSNSRFLPAQDRVFHIFSSRIIMANKWHKSPANLNTFILCVIRFKWRNKSMKYFFVNTIWDVEIRGVQNSEKRFLMLNRNCQWKLTKSVDDYVLMVNETLFKVL